MDIYTIFTAHFLNVYMDTSHPSHAQAVQLLFTNVSISGSFISWVSMSHTRLMQSQHVTPSLDTRLHQVSFTKNHSGWHNRCVVSFFTPDNIFSTYFLLKMAVNVLHVILLYFETTSIYTGNSSKQFMALDATLHMIVAKGLLV